MFPKERNKGLEMHFSPPVPHSTMADKGVISEQKYASPSNNDSFDVALTRSLCLSSPFQHFFLWLGLMALTPAIRHLVNQFPQHLIAGLTIYLHGKCPLTVVQQ